MMLLMQIGWGIDVATNEGMAGDHLDVLLKI